MSMSIVTKTGDTGTTGLFGTRRVPKDDARIEAYGTVDELNASIGVACADPALPVSAREQLEKIQHLLFRVGGDLATPLETTLKVHRVAAVHTALLEGWITALEATVPPQTGFVLPGGTAPAAALHLARTICRRAERRIVTLTKKEEINGEIQIFLNRLSDYLFILARKTNADLGASDVEVQY